MRAGRWADGRAGACAQARMCAPVEGWRGATAAGGYSAAQRRRGSHTQRRRVAASRRTWQKCEHHSPHDSHGPTREQCGLCGDAPCQCQGQRCAEHAQAGNSHPDVARDVEERHHFGVVAVDARRCWQLNFSPPLLRLPPWALFLLQCKHRGRKRSHSLGEERHHRPAHGGLLLLEKDRARSGRVRGRLCREQLHAGCTSQLRRGCCHVDVLLAGGLHHRLCAKLVEVEASAALW